MRRLNLHEVLEMIHGLPSLPETHAQVMQLADNPNANTSDVAAIVSTDTSLAARVLQVANTPFYGMSGRIESIDRAIVVLGARTVCNLAIGAGVVEALQQPDLLDECGIDVWKHCLQTAIAAQALAEHNGTIDPDVAFTGGLLHDMGKLALSAMFPATYRHVLEEHSASGIPLTRLERQVFDIDHTQTGAILCTMWNLPSTLRHIVEDHHAVTANPSSAKFAVACGSILARLISPQASGAVHVRQTELNALLRMAPRSDLLRRLVVSQSLKPPVGTDDCNCSHVTVDIEDPALREAIHLIALACGCTPVATSRSASRGLVISESSCVHDKQVQLAEFVSHVDEDLLLNVSAIHSSLLFHSCAPADDGRIHAVAQIS